MYSSRGRKKEEAEAIGLITIDFLRDAHTTLAPIDAVRAVFFFSFRFLNIHRNSREMWLRDRTRLCVDSHFTMKFKI